MAIFLWAEACNTTVYIQNWTPHAVLGTITPESVFTSSKPEVSQFRIFCSTTYCHVPSEKRKKLEMTAEKGYLVGYNKNAKAYCIYIPESRKVMVCEGCEVHGGEGLQKVSRDAFCYAV